MTRRIMSSFIVVAAVAIGAASFAIAHAPSRPAMSFANLQTELVFGGVNVTPMGTDTVIQVDVPRRPSFTYGTIGSSVRDGRPGSASFAYGTRGSAVRDTKQGPPILLAGNIACTNSVASTQVSSRCVVTR